MDQILVVLFTIDYSRLTRQPGRDIRDILLNVAKLLGLTFEAVTGRFVDKAWRSCVDVPIVINEVVKAGLGYRTAEAISFRVRALLECND